MALSYDERVEMLRLADDIQAAEISDLDTHQTAIIVRALRATAEREDREQPHA